MNCTTGSDRVSVNGSCGPWILFVLESILTRSRILFSFAALCLSSLLAYLLLFGGASVVPDDQLQEIVYVDTESGVAFLLRARNSLESHPETGETTLIPGMYCAQCQSWKPVGPLEILQTSRTMHRCPVHKTILLRDGPLPDSP